MSLTYRKDIDGLRAVAVIAVVVYHAFPALLPGGFIGVDVFFVISGFLISTIIFGDVDAGTFRFRTFYARRVRRIFPALAVVLGTCLLAGWFLLQPDVYRSLAVQTVAGAGFVSNLVLWSQAGYFDAAAELKPLLHLWSLGIEEQFYFVFPLIVVLVRRLKISRTATLGVLFASSFALSLFLTRTDPTAAFYSPLSRFWELLVGSSLSLLVGRRRVDPVARPAWHRNAAAIAGLVLLGFGVVVFDGRVPFPGWRALVPVVAAALLIWAGPGARVNSALLSSRVMVGIGLISYPLYLWHWPLLSFARIRYGHAPPVSMRLSLVVAAFGLAYATFRLVERPLRHTSSISHVTAWLSAAVVTIGSLGIGIARADGVPSRYGEQLEALASYDYEFLVDARGTGPVVCWVATDDPPDAFDRECVDEAFGRGLTVVWGDSHAARLYAGLRHYTGPDAPLAQFTRSSCPPVLDIESEPCRASNDYVLRRITELQPDTVVLFAAWNDYPNTDTEDRVEAQLRATIAALAAQRISRIVLMGPAPRWEDSLPSNMLTLASDRGDGSFPSRTDYRLRQDSLDKDAEMRTWFRGDASVEYFSVTDVLCDSNGCLTTTDGLVDGLTSWDNGHFTTPGAALVAERLVRSWGGLPR